VPTVSAAGGAGGAENAPKRSLLASYKELLGSKTLLEQSPVVQVVYKVEVPIGKAETFLAAFWKHEATLQSYCLRVSLCKSLDGVKGVAKTEEANPDEEQQQQHGKFCRGCLEEQRGEPCTDFIPGPLRRVKEETRTMRSVSEQFEREEQPPLPRRSKDDNTRLSRSISEVTDEQSTSERTSLSHSTSAAVAPAHTNAIGGSGSSAATAMLATSPSPKKKPAPLVKHAGITGAWRSRVLNFVERRCRLCGHLPHEHAGSVVATFVLNLDFKTRAAWASAFSSFDDIASEAMKDCIARVYEPSVLRIVDEQTAVADDEVYESAHR
jgi:hypothetical protein